MNVLHSSRVRLGVVIAAEIAVVVLIVAALIDRSWVTLVGAVLIGVIFGVTWLRDRQSSQPDDQQASGVDNDNTVPTPTDAEVAQAIEGADRETEAVRLLRVQYPSLGLGTATTLVRRHRGR